MRKSITIVCSAYKSEKYLLKFYNSILNLKNRDEINCIIVFNEASEKEKEIADKFYNDHPELFELIYVSGRETIGASLNRGYKAARTEYIGYVDIDDIRTPDSYILQKKTLDDDPSIDFTYGDYIIVPVHGLSDGKLITTNEYNKKDFTRGCQAGPTHFFRRSILDKAGYWDEQFKSGGDFEYQVRVAASGVKFKKTEGLLLYKTNEVNSTSAASNFLQPLEATVVYLRYGIYDKIHYEYYEDANKYDLLHFYNFGSRNEIRGIIVNYDEYFNNAKSLIIKGKIIFYYNFILKSFKKILLRFLKPELYNHRYKILKLK